VSESIPDLRGRPKPEAYAELHQLVEHVLHGIDDDVSGMATMSAMLHHAFGHLWTGFYRVAGRDQLRVGPYQGSLGCLEIAFGRGVCGTAAAQQRSIIVEDVGAYPDHIVCDARAQSEIVVPVFDAGSSLIGILDVDSARLGAFDEDDREGLERLVRWFARADRGDD
jgi:L-methionine (R)-S-oxide reductase